MDRSIFNLTKYSIFHYLHCTDTQMNTHYSSALRPPLCHRRKKKKKETQFGRTAMTIRSHTLAH